MCQWWEQITDISHKWLPGKEDRKRSEKTEKEVSAKMFRAQWNILEALKIY